jgi:hypothetical protein
MPSTSSVPTGPDWRSVPLPPKLASRPKDERGYVVPFFVAWFDGKPDFRIIDPAAMTACVRKQLCWLCGQPLGRNMVFPIGPMCSINRITSEPPSHRDCALYAVRVCPFLTIPRMHYQDHNKPEGAEPPGGVLLEHNPGVTCLWHTRSYRPVRVPRQKSSKEGVLFSLGEAIHVEWYARGRTATHDEILASIAKGLPKLLELAEEEGEEAMVELVRSVQRARTVIGPDLLPDTRDDIIRLYGGAHAHA